MDDNAQKLQYLTYLGAGLAAFPVVPLAMGMLFLDGAPNRTAIVIMLAAGLLPMLAVAARAIVRSIRGTSWPREWRDFALNARAIGVGSAVLVLAAYTFYGTKAGFVPLLIPALVALEGPVALALASRTARNYASRA
ncbi:hypothetical protein J2S49_000660 [Arcanobacterium wilhelmae]|uniref:Uncharacterized protein n=1 Tax=Arcanobacterium wilhelmae TaxID=1803177 RepID=A0ABT9NA43_9ACTO|nr:hypothetical protein [Arcanobacterium wilhelmae]MDP9800584.1 hypothetical protein [Arcanobacterium wilhelmae]